MKIFLRLLGKVRLHRKLSDVDYEQSEMNPQLSVVSYQLLILIKWLLAKSWLTPKPYSLIAFLILVFVSCSAALAQDVDVHSTPAAQAETEITPLKIGDKIPDELWEMYFPVVSATSDQVQYLSLGDFKDKLIILDFWATWCGTCISFMPHMQKLQREFLDDMLIIPITNEKTDKIQSFLKNTTSPILKSVKPGFQTIVDDHYLWDSFEFKVVPHIVVISNNKVKAFAMPIDLDSENISALIEGEESYIAKKRYKILEKPLLELSFDDVKTQKPLYYSAITGNTDGFINVAGHNKDSINGIQHYYQTSLPIVHLYSLTGLFGGKAINFKYRVLEVNEPQAYANFKNEDGLNAITDLAWKRENTYNYEIIAPFYLSEKEIKYKFKEDLDFYLGLNARIEKRLIPVMILKEKMKTVRTKFLSDKMVYVLNTIPTIPLLINEAKLTEGDMLNLSEFDLTLPALNTVLEEYGLELIEDEREMEMFVLTERGYQKSSSKLKFSRYGYIYPNKNLNL